MRRLVALNYCARHFICVLGLVSVAAVARADWRSVDSMPTSRAFHSSGIINNLWYVAGGSSSGPENFPAQIDVYDPLLGHWHTEGGTIGGREYVRAVSDPTNGVVVFTGGFLPSGPSEYMPINESDIVAFTGLLSMPMLASGRYLHAVALANGKVIVSGGWGTKDMAEVVLDDAEIMDVVGRTWRPGGTMPAGPRSGHTMTTLQDSRNVLVVGGCLPDHAMTAVDKLDVGLEVWSATTNTKTPRCRHSAVLLKDGRVLVAGSLDLLKVEHSAELYEPASQGWMDAAPMADARYDHEMVLLPDNRVLVVGGTNDATQGESGALSTTEIYDPSSGRWTTSASMREGRRWPTLAILSDGVYVAGGANATGQLQTVEHLTWSDLGMQPVDASADLDGSDVSSSDGRVETKVPLSGHGNGGCSCTVAKDVAHDLKGSVAGLAVVLWTVRRKSRVYKPSISPTPGPRGDGRSAGQGHLLGSA